MALAVLGAPAGEIEARLSADLSAVETTARFTDVPTADGAVEVVLGAQRFLQPPDPIPPHADRELFVGGVERGGFERVSLEVDGRPCPVASPEASDRVREAPDGAWIVRCPAVGPRVSVSAQARVVIPERNGPFGRRGRQVSLGGGWFPTPRRPDGPAVAYAYRVRAEGPGWAATVLGDRYTPSRPSGERRTIQWSGVARQVPWLVLPGWTASRPAAGGRARFVSPSLRRPGDDRGAALAAQVIEALDDGFAFLDEQGLARPAAGPLLVVQAPLRHDLARVADGVVLVSDRAFRLTPVDRFLRFHRYPLLRAIYGLHVLRGRADPEAWFGADAAGAYLRDAYVRDRAGRAEDAFDVLLLFSFIPAVDSLLYAPQLPFVGAYFRLIREADPLRARLVDPGGTRPLGKVAYEKLLDRFGPVATASVARDVVAGAQLLEAAEAHLGADGVATVRAWWGRYPDLQYSLQSWSSEPAPGACDVGPTCHRARVTVRRTGEVAAEPVQVRLVDDDGGEREVWVESSTAAARTVTATLAAALDLVVLDPHGRLAETPSVEVPSPKYDNRSRPQWRFLLNSFNVLYSPSANNLDTALDVGFSRRRDVRWRFAARASYAPEAVSLSTRASYRFGHRVTPDQLAQWVGGVIGGEYLRPEFAGTEESAVAVSGTLFWGYDDRKTAWAPEAGLGLRASLGVSHSFGTPSADQDVTRDAVNLTLRALKSWRLDAAHQLSIRASAGAYLFGTPRNQLLYALGGRRNVRGYVVDDGVGRARGIVSAEWVHPLMPDLDLNAAWLVWVTGLDGALYADVAVLGDDPLDALSRAPRADVGYGFRVYLDYFGVRPGVMALDLALPLVDDEGRFSVGSPAVYIDFAQSFFAF